MTIESPPIPGAMYFWGYGVSLISAFALTFILILAFSKLNTLARPLNKLMISMGKPVIPFGGIPVILSFFFVLWFAFGLLELVSFVIFEFCVDRQGGGFLLSYKSPTD